MPAKSFGLTGIDSINATENGGFITAIADTFNERSETLRQRMLTAQNELLGGPTKGGTGTTAADPGNPGKLANFQVASSEYQLYRNAMTSEIKMFRDLASGIISKWT